MGFAGADVISGGGGNDEVRYDVDFAFGGAAGVTVNLVTNQAIDGFGNTDVLNSIEAVRGTRSGDSFVGSAVNEVFRGLGGSDSIDGGGGTDWVAYDRDIFSREESQGLSGVTVNLDTSTAIDSFGSLDHLANIEDAAGGTLGDTLIGSAGDNVFRGLAGDDSIDGLGGNDTVDYSQDQPYGDLVFLNGAGGVTVNLAAGSAIDGFGGTDSLTNVENAIGSAFSDLFVASSAANLLNGGGGIDTVSYALAVGGITANLDVGIGAGGDASGDSYVSIEGLIGSSFGDTLVGLAGVTNTLNSGDGDDFIYGEGIDVVNGGAGSDVFFGGQGSALNVNLATSSLETVWGSFVGDVMDGSASSTSLTMVGQGLTGGANADTMTGGSGNDFVYYRAADVIIGGAGNDWAVATLSASGVTLNIAASGFENAWGSTSGDNLTAAGSSTTAVIVGDAGNDILTGGNAGDFLYGFAENDTLTGGAGADNLIGGDGTDTFVFGSGWGTDIVWDWQDTAELFNLQGSGAANFAALTIDQNYFGSGNAFVTFGSNHILVVGGAGLIDMGDFIF
jgi:Ca2+-binding RTX toxin-like protein